MEKQEIMERVQEIFRDVFDNEDIVISDETNSDCIEDWDSLTNIQLDGGNRDVRSVYASPLPRYPLGRTWVTWWIA